ncbi:hypothetical protein EV126DRAFT_396464 [Verticillium dahliae]|nr:hypothetical protein EV126DRAFT_396464 [Verticillium dahliae]
MPPLILVSMDVAWLASRRCDCLRERAGIASTHDTSSLLSFSLPPSSSVSLFLSTSPPFLSMLPPLAYIYMYLSTWQTSYHATRVDIKTPSHRIATERASIQPNFFPHVDLFLSIHPDISPATGEP